MISNVKNATIDVQLISVSRVITAYPGDELIIFEGICIGVKVSEKILKAESRTLITGITDTLIGHIYASINRGTPRAKINKYIYAINPKITYDEISRILHKLEKMGTIAVVDDNGIHRYTKTALPNDISKRKTAAVKTVNKKALPRYSTTKGK